MPEHEPKLCPRCGGGFECRQGSIHRCQCVDIILSDGLREAIAQRYDDCLCRDCLLELSGAGAAPGNPAPEDNDSIFKPMTPPAEGRLCDAIAEEIERQIAEGRLHAGDALPAERELARLMAVSRPSMREALLILVSRELLSVRRNAGYTVAEVKAPSLTDPLLRLMKTQPKAVADVLELRQGVETLGAELAARRANAGDLKDIAEALDKMERAQDAGRAEEAADWDARLHLAVAEASHNVALVTMMRGLFTVLREHVRRARAAMLVSAEGEEALRQQHRALVAAIAARDPAAAVVAAETHLQYLRDGLGERRTDAA